MLAIQNEHFDLDTSLPAVLDDLPDLTEATSYLTGSGSVEHVDSWPMSPSLTSPLSATAPTKGGGHRARVGRPATKPATAAVQRQRALNKRAQERYQARLKEKQVVEARRQLELKAALEAARAEAQILASHRAALEQLLEYRDSSITSLHAAASVPSSPYGFRRRLRPCCYHHEPGFSVAQNATMHVSCILSAPDQPPAPGLLLPPEQARILRSLNPDVIFERWMRNARDMRELAELMEVLPNLDAEKQFLNFMNQGVSSYVTEADVLLELWK